VLLLLLVATVAGAASEPARAGGDLRAQAREVADADVIDQIEASGSARVVVYVDAPRSQAQAATRRVVDALPEHELRSRRTMGRLPVFAGELTAAGLARLAAGSEVLRISLDRPIYAQLNQARPLVQADAVHARGVTGSGTVAVIIDTGIDLDHPDLADAIVDEACFCLGAAGSTGCCPNGLEVQTGAGQDDYGHGTQVAGVVTSAGVYAGLGIAPDTSLVAIKILAADGSGTSSDLVSAMAWVLANHPEADVVNMSLGSGLYDGDCDSADAVTMAYATAIGDLRDAGILSVAGAGNDGAGDGMIAPACIADAISVGAVWDNAQGAKTTYGCTDDPTAADMVACWSNSSATTDVFAPGGIMASSKLDGTVRFQSGTSFATPVVTGCALLFRSVFPDMTPTALERAIEDSSVQVTDDTNGLVFPRVNCNEALSSLLPRVPGLASEETGRLGLAVLVGLIVLSAVATLSARR
jgi:subtilisin family serine protease